MQMIGWTSKSDRPIVLTDRDGADVNVLELGPKLVKERMRKDWHNIIAEHLAKKISFFGITAKTN